MENKTASQSAVNFLRLVTRPFLSYPKDFELSAIELQKETTITMRPHSNDYGFVAGKRGVMFNSLAILIREIGFRFGRPMRLVLLASNVGGIEEKIPFKRSEEWNCKLFRELIEQAAVVVLPAPASVVVEDQGDVSIVRLACGPFNGPDDDPVAERIEQAFGTLLLSVGKGLGRNNVLVELIEGKENKT